MTHSNFGEMIPIAHRCAGYPAWRTPCAVVHTRERPVPTGKLAKVGLAVAAAVLSISLAASAAESQTPYQRGLNLQYGLEMGRIRKCDAGAQPNCVSTSSGAISLYLPPFQAKGESAAEAMDTLEAALRAMYPDGSNTVVLVEKTDVSENKGGCYRRWAVPSVLVKVDYVEVYITDELTAFYRSQGSATKYVPLITQPISDGDAQKKRYVWSFQFL